VAQSGCCSKKICKVRGCVGPYTTELKLSEPLVCNVYLSQSLREFSVPPFILDMMLPHHIYETLAAESSFRLFCLEKKQDLSSGLSEEVKIHLFEATLEDPPEYEAVSYAWNRDGPDSSIICNGHLLPVASNVKAMLHDLQKAGSIGTFWIDSICINQASISEKNKQVPKMRSIYRAARLVWIWLGEESYEIKTTMEFLSEISNTGPTQVFQG
jgi:hypothetical protein